MVAAYLIDPARRRYPLDELLEQAGIEAVVEGGDGGAGDARRGRARSSEDQQPEIDRLELRGLLEEVELPLVEVLCRLERQGVKLDTYRLGETAARVSRGDRRARAARSGSWPGRSSRSARRSSSAQVLFEKLGLSRKRRGKTGFSTDARVLRAIRDEHEIVAEDRDVARAVEAQEHLPRLAARR